MTDDSIQLINLKTHIYSAFLQYTFLNLAVVFVFVICTRQQSSAVTLPALAIALAPIMESEGRHDTSERGMPSSEAHTCITWRENVEGK